MKNLNKYIIEKLDINKVNLGVLYTEGTIDDMKNYLLDNGFKELEPPVNEFGRIEEDEMFELFDSHKKEKVFSIIDDIETIFFAGKRRERISEKEPVIYFTSRNGKFWYGTENWIGKSTTIEQHTLTKEEFVEKIKIYL